ncbi:methyltransferase domain-containing protein [Tautonia sp. JC769]|uniref:class I SAM-dependent methyltransferase n=1 Tax=Tautonia sp. JC769 TaxID=3232135 RepID=UPI00345AB314
MDLLADEDLERSAVVANCRMNRERNLAGSNGYDRELGLDPLGFLKSVEGQRGGAAWLDLCCGSGTALIQAAERLRDEGIGDRISMLGVDLVGMFRPIPEGFPALRLIEASVRRWEPDRTFDLITCVHGLHYVGDKLGLIGRAASWLSEDGLFLASLDLANIKLSDDHIAGRRVATDLRRAGLDYDRRRRLVACRGRRDIAVPYRYLGADDRAGPNVTGQPAVDSHYEPAQVRFG